MPGFIGSVRLEQRKLDDKAKIKAARGLDTGCGGGAVAVTGIHSMS